MGFVEGLIELFSAINRRERERMFPALEFPPDYTPTERIVHKMLIENTGAHLLDSGDHYGRNWERNRLIQDFRKVPRVNVEVWSNEVIVHYNVFHFLVDHLEYVPELDREFHKFAHSEGWEDEPWLACMEGWLSEGLGLPDHWWWTTNTYNYENIISQVLQYAMFTLDGDEYNAYVLLQTHNGCDVRGGYSTPHVFKVLDRDYFLIAQSDVTATCTKCGDNWVSDDTGYHWYHQGVVSWDDEGPLWIFDEENNKVYHKECGGEIEFGVLYI